MFTKDPQNFVFNLDDARVPQKSYRSINNTGALTPATSGVLPYALLQQNRQKHPTQKPEGLYERMILSSSMEGAPSSIPSPEAARSKVCQQTNRKSALKSTPVRRDDRRALAAPFYGFDRSTKDETRSHRFKRRDARIEYMKTTSLVPETILTRSTTSSPRLSQSMKTSRRQSAAGAVEQMRKRCVR